MDYFETRFLPEALPENGENDMPFSPIGHLSQIVSSQYLWSTSKGGKLGTLVPSQQPSEFGVRIPRNYQGKSLKLWRFTLLPKHADESADVPQP